MTEISPKGSRRVWALARELFTPKSWKVPTSIEDFRVSSERKTDGIAAVAEAYFVRHTIGGSVVHEN